MKFILLAVLLVSSTIVFAEEECGSSQSELNACAERGQKNADAELNQLYKTQMSYLQSPENKERLKNSELAWIKFRDAACKYEVTSEGGSKFGMDMSFCIANYTKQRILDLKGYISCRDNGCPY